MSIVAGCQAPSSPGGPALGSVEAANQALQARQFDAAIADADDYLRGQPKGPQAAEAGYDKGQAFQRKDVNNLDERRRNLFEAKSAYTAALNARPSRELEGNIRLELSTVALFQDDFPACIEQAAKAGPLVDAPPAKAWLLYNTGVAQQRLSRFTDADQTFRQVSQKYPGTPQAAAAQQHIGQRLFYVQLATYASPSDADRATLSLRSTGQVVSRRSDVSGHTVLDIGPFSTYPNAQQQRDALLPSFPTAVIVP
jgi:tetratricopeptide (TPR) repeat protein